MVVPTTCVGIWQVWVLQVYRNDQIAQDEKLPTALVSMALMTVLMSVVFSVVGMRRGADLVQYLPFPVTAGFLALIGAAITKSALIMTVYHHFLSFYLAPCLSF